MNLYSGIIGASVTDARQHLDIVSPGGKVSTQMVRVGRFPRVHRRVGARDDENLHAGILAFGVAGDQMVCEWTGLRGTCPTPVHGEQAVVPIGFVTVKPVGLMLAEGANFPMERLCKEVG